MIGTVWMFINDLPWRETFGLILEIINVVLWIFWAVSWIVISILQSMLQWLLIIGWKYVSTLWMFVYKYTCLWKFVDPFVTAFTVAWDYTSFMAMSLYREGSYIVKASRINYGPIFGYLWKSHTPLVVVLVVVATCLLIWYNQQNRSRRKRLEGSREGEIHQQRNSRSQSASHDNNNIPVDSDSVTNSTSIEKAGAILSPGAPKQDHDNTLQESTDSDIELLRKQLCQAKKELSQERGKVLHVKKKLEEANKELSQERDKVLCVELLQRQLREANEELSQEQEKLLCIVCQDLKREVILKPCNHYCLCPKCSKALKQCPICKRRIGKTEKIYNA